MLIVEQFVTHALGVATRAYVLEKGEVAYAGSAAELMEDEEFVRGSYLGDVAADPDDLADLRAEGDARRASPGDREARGGGRTRSERGCDGPPAGSNEEPETTKNGNGGTP